MFRNWSNPFADGQRGKVNIPALGELIGSRGRPIRVGVLISGRGSNLQALLDARETSEKWKVVVVVSNVVDAQGLARAENVGIPTMTIPHGEFANREAFEEKLDTHLRAHKVDLIVLAGFMRVLSPSFCESWRDRAINIHPSLLPDFRGLDTHRRALEAGVRWHGCTVHFVRAELDDGPIIDTARVRVRPGDTERTLAARVLANEHRILPKAVDSFAKGCLRVENERVLGNDPWTRFMTMVKQAKASSSKFASSGRTPRSSVTVVGSMGLAVRSRKRRAIPWMFWTFSARTTRRATVEASTSIGVTIEQKQRRSFERPCPARSAGQSVAVREESTVL